MEKWFEIFRTGKWNGGRWDQEKEEWVPYTQADLDTMVANFDRSGRDVPLKIGHDSFWGGEEKPALGWVAALKRAGNRLLAQARDVQQELVDAVNTKRFPKRSVELFDNLDGNGLTLGGVAFLGGSQPAVAGMADFDFAVRSDGRRIFTLGGGFVDGDGKETEDAGDGAGAPRANQTKQGGGDNMTIEQMQAEIAKAVAAAIDTFKGSDEFKALAAKAAKADELQTTVDSQHTAAVEAECKQFSEDLLAKKRITPAVLNGDGSKRPGLAVFLAGLTAEQRETAKAIFAEAVNGADHSALLEETDNAAPRDGETEAADVEAFAARHGLDPKTLAAELRKGATGIV